MEMNKKCTKCEIEKDLSEFYGEGRPHCKDCERASARERMSREDNRIRTAYRDSKKAAKKHGVYDDLTLDDVYYTFAIAQGHCAYCGEYAGDKLQLEHIFAMSTGGHNTVANITTACGQCNRQKSDEAIMTHIQTTKFDKDNLKALVDRIAYRMGVHRLEVVDLMQQQQRDFSNREVERIMKRIKQSRR